MIKLLHKKFGIAYILKFLDSLHQSLLFQLTVTLVKVRSILRFNVFDF
jgi:hypothetical protein